MLFARESEAQRAIEAAGFSVMGRILSRSADLRETKSINRVEIRK